MFLTYHLALNGLEKVAGRSQTMLCHLEEYRKVPGHPITAWTLKDICVRAMLRALRHMGLYTKNYSRFGKTQFQNQNQKALSK